MDELTELTWDELKVCALMHVSPEDYKRAKKLPELSGEDFERLSEAEAQKLGVELEDKEDAT